MMFGFVLPSLFPVILSIFVLWIRIEDKGVSFQLIFLTILSFFGFLFTIRAIPSVSELCLKANLSGIDINKEGKTPIPECLGIVPATIYLVCVTLFQPLFATTLREYNAALTSICFVILLGFGDDVLDLRWRVKIWLSFLATVPLLVAYNGSTTILIPITQQAINLGFLYHAVMAFLAVFCTNSINIFAGINGLEVGQSLVIACSILIHNTIQLLYFKETNPSMSLLAISFITPFITTSSALLYYNWYPSKVFVGDTYTYFAGMTFAVVGITGHFSKTLMLFFIPQLLNFAISLPQLIGIIPCPRHRLPRLNRKTGKLEAVTNHWNLLNLTLYLLGPLSEHSLCKVMMVFQILCCAFGFFVRYYVSLYFYDKSTQIQMEL